MLLDWMTLTIMAIGLVILGFFVVIPINEFRQIFRSLRDRPARDDHAGDGDEEGRPR